MYIIIIGKKCVAPGCDMGYQSAKSRNEKIGVYLFPANEERGKIWVKKILRDLVINKELVLCAAHFTDADFIIHKKDKRTSRVVEGTKLKHKRLRMDVIPSIWPNCPHYLSSPVTVRPTSSKTTDARQKKQDAIIDARIEEQQGKDAFHSLEEMDAKDHSLPPDIKFKETEKISYFSICMAEKPNIRYCLKVWSLKCGVLVLN